jgi:hypothetical protein
MKMSIITDSNGELLGAVQGHALNEHKGGVQAEVTFAPGHQVHQVEVDDDLATIDDAAEFQRRLKQHLPQP